LHNRVLAHGSVPTGEPISDTESLIPIPMADKRTARSTGRRELPRPIDRRAGEPWRLAASRSGTSYWRRPLVSI